MSHTCEGSGYILNVHITVRGRGANDSEIKRHISRRIAAIGQAIHRRGRPHVGVTVYEKGPQLHAHHLLHLDERDEDLLFRWHDGDGGERYVTPADDFGPEYITKQRQCLSPQFERALKRLRRASARIPGKRLSFTKAAQQIMLDADETASRPARSAA